MDRKERRRAKEAKARMESNVDVAASTIMPSRTATTSTKSAAIVA